MRYWPALTYFAGKPNGGLGNLGWGTLCLLLAHAVPGLGVVTQMVWLGYLAEVAEDLDRDIDKAEYDDFRTDRVVKYLARGVYPFLSALVLGVGGTLLAAAAAAVGVVAYLGTDNPWVGVAVGGALAVPVVFGTVALSLPVQLHAQLSRGLDVGDLWRFTTDFVARVGWDLAGATLGYWVLSSVLMVLGLLAACVGLYPAATIASAAQEHILVQLYHRYLEEGGAPIGTKPRPAGPAADDAGGD